MASKRKKQKTPSPLTGLVTGLAAAPTEGVVRGATRRLGGRTSDDGSRGRATASPDGPEADKKGKKKKRKRDKRGAKKGREASADAGVALLTELAAKARKRLAKLADRLGSVTEKRNALIGELATLQEGIATALRRFESGGETSHERAPGKKKTKTRKAGHRTPAAARTRRNVDRPAAGSTAHDEGEPVPIDAGGRDQG